MGAVQTESGLVQQLRGGARRSRTDEVGKASGYAMARQAPAGLVGIHLKFVSSFADREPVASAHGWSVWWRWLAIWIPTVVSVLVAVALLIVHWRGQHKRAKQPPYVSFYLHDQSVMDLYQYRYRGALEQGVEARFGGRSQIRAGAGTPMVNFTGSLERNREEFRKYLERSEPITVIGILMDVLEDDLVHVDLQRASLVTGKNLDIRQRRIRLSELGASTYVLARGGR